MDVTVVDPRDVAAFDTWFDVYDAVARHERPEDQPAVREELRALALDGLRADEHLPGDEERVSLLALDAGRPVAVGRLELPLTDNAHLASLEVHVLPDHRRRGAGTTLLETLVARAERAGRTTLMAEVDEPPAVVGRSPGRAFAEHAGFAAVLVDVRRDLVLPVPAERLDAIEQRSRPHAQGYEVVSWRDRCPDELVDDRADLEQRMSTDTPLGGLDWREERWDAARVRRGEELAAKQGRASVTAGAVETATGRLVAFTQLAWVEAQPVRVHQWNTLVRPEHRGARLGTLVKVEALRRAGAENPAGRHLSTWNAASNTHMIAVNEALGFTVAGQLVAYQRELGASRRGASAVPPSPLP